MDVLHSFIVDNSFVVVASSVIFLCLLFLLIVLWPKKKSCAIEIRVVFEKGSIFICQDSEQVKKFVEEIKSAIYAGV